MAERGASSSAPSPSTMTCPEGQVMSAADQFYSLAFLIPVRRRRPRSSRPHYRDKATKTVLGAQRRQSDCMGFPWR